jgi:hypothetical protein
MKAQAALAKAKAVLDKAESAFDMDLIQNTAALMGKVTADETLRLKLQQAILLGNADQAGNLAQQLLASQIAAMKLSSTNPLGGFTDSLKAALDGVRDLRDELAKLGVAKVPVGSLIPMHSSRFSCSFWIWRPQIQAAVKALQAHNSQTLTIKTILLAEIKPQANST